MLDARAGASSLNIAPTAQSNLADLARSVMTQPAIDAVLAHPRFAEAARRTVHGWAPRPGDDLSKSRALQDVGLFAAGLWCMQLDASPAGLTHSSLTAAITTWGLASRGRVGPMLAYLRFRNMIQLAPSSDRRITRYTPTVHLRTQFGIFFERELHGAAPIFPEAEALLARWGEPGLLSRMVTAYSTILLASQQMREPDDGPNLDVFSHRRAGLIILGQILTAADDGSEFPPAGPVRLVLSDLARRSAASRGQVQAVLREGEKAGFLLRDEDGLTVLSDDLRRHVSDFLPMYWMALAWAARVTLGEDSA